MKHRAAIRRTSAQSSSRPVCHIQKSRLYLRLQSGGYQIVLQVIKASSALNLFGGLGDLLDKSDEHKEAGSGAK